MELFVNNLQQFSDFWFLLDIIFNLRTGVILDGPEGDVILDPTKIRTTYLKGWFAIDFISTFPFDIFFGFRVSGGDFPCVRNLILTNYQPEKLPTNLYDED